tara:strand:+ start:441 stop:827 length:387 start_codon:yes stop_codon:yes gene_type:complete
MDIINNQEIDQQAKKLIKYVTYSKKYYDKKKNDPEFIKKRNERQRIAYNTNEEYRQKKLDHASNNREYMTARSRYNYYKRNNKIENFEKAHPEKYKLLLEKDHSRYLISEPEPPSLSENSDQEELEAH